MKLDTQVGHSYDAATLGRDLRYLWSLGRFDDIRVETATRPEGIAVVFRVSVAPHRFLREIRIQPNSYGLNLHFPARTPIDPLRAHQIAIDAQRRLNFDGFPAARVDYTLTPKPRGLADLTLNVTPGNSLRVRQVRFSGDDSMRGQLRALRTHRILPGIPHLWNGWRLLPSYSQAAVDADMARLQSLYIGRGYFDAQVRPGRVDIRGKDAVVTIAASPGKRYAVEPGLCPALLSQRHDAQGSGVLDFNASIDSSHPGADPEVRLGPTYRVGRIEFTGNHRYPDSTVRGHFLLDEGDLFDERQLRRSIARLNRSMLFDPVDPASVAVQPDPRTGVADVAVRLHERKPGSWNLSGPVGPMSLAGPLQASLGWRLPGIGRGLFDLSTYTVSLGLFAFAHPVLPILNAPQGFTPVLGLQRPFTPTAGWKSGFLLAPQLGWRATFAGYAATQITQRLLPRLSGERTAEPELPVTVTRSAGDVRMLCAPPAPRLRPLRAAATVALHFLSAFPGI